jgi:hypothetical protein
VLLRVGASGSGTALSSNYASVYLDEINPNSASAAVTSSLVTGVTLSGTDYTQGSLSLSSDKSRISFGGMSATAGTPISLDRPYGIFDRVIASIDLSGTFDVYVIPNTTYDGVIKAVCGKNSSGAWFMGNSTNVNLGYFDYDNNTWTTVDDDTMFPNTGCGVSQSGNLYLLFDRFGAVWFKKVSNAPTEAVTTPGGFGNLGTSRRINDRRYLPKQIITNKNENQLWICIVSLSQAGDSGILTGTPSTSLSQMLWTPDNYRVTGMALSPNESLLYFTTTTKLFSVESSCFATCVPTTLRTAAANTEFRGLAPVPIFKVTPTRTPSVTPSALSSSNPDTPTPSVTPRALSQYTSTFYADSSCLTSVGSVQGTDRTCLSGTVAGMSREVYATVDGAGTTVSWTMYIASSTCTGTSVASSTATVGSCSSTIDEDGISYYYRITLGSSSNPVTPTPSVTPRALSQYTSTFYADSSCLTSVGSVQGTDRTCTPGTVAGYSREIYATVDGAGTTVSWQMYTSYYSLCAGTLVASSTATTVGACSSTVANDGLVYYFKITLSSSANTVTPTPSQSRAVTPTPTSSITPPAIVRYRSTFYLDSDCSTYAGSILLTDKSCTYGYFNALSREIYATLNAPSKTVSWSMYASTYSSCTGSVIASSTSSPIGVCTSFYDTYSTYYFIITLGSSEASATSSPTKSITSSITRTPSMTPRSLTKYVATFYSDGACSASAGSLTITDRSSCNSGIVAGYSRGIYASLNTAGTSVSWSLYTSMTCSGLYYLYGTTPLNTCSSAVSTDGLTYVFKITLLGQLQPSETSTPSPSSTRSVSGTPWPITSLTTTFYGDSTCSNSAGSITMNDNMCTSGTVAGLSREVRGTLDAIGSSVSWKMYIPTFFSFCSGTIVASGDASPLNVCSSTTANDGLRYFFKITLSGTFHPSPTPSSRPVSMYYVAFFYTDTCNTPSYDSLTLGDGKCSNSYIGYYGGSSIGNLNSDGSRVSWKAFANSDCTGDIVASADDSIINKCSRTVTSDGSTYYFKIYLQGALRSSVTPSPALPAPSTPPISASDTVIVKGSLRFEGLNWASVVSSGKEDAVKNAIATELASAAKVSSESITIISIKTVNSRLLQALSKMRRLAGSATEVEYSIKTKSSGKDLVSTLSAGLSSSSSSGSLTSLKNAVATAAGVSPSSITVSQPRQLSVEVQPGAQTDPTTTATSSMSLTVIIAAAAGGGAALVLIGVAAYCLCKKRVVEKQVDISEPPPSITVSGVNPMNVSGLNPTNVSGVNPMIVIHRKVQKKEEDEDKDEEPE